MAKTKDPTEYLSSGQAGARIGISSAMVRRYAASGVLRPDSITGEAYGFLPKTIDAFIEARNRRALERVGGGEVESAADVEVVEATA